MRTRPFLALLAAVALSLPLFALADSAGGQGSNFVPLANYQSSTLNTVYASNNLAGYLSALFSFSLSIGAIIAVVMIVIGGYLYMGSDMWATKNKAKEMIRDAIIGLLLLLGIYLILYQINPCILSLQVSGLNIGGSYGNAACQTSG